MTENELKLELLCYKQYVNPECDLENMTKDDLEEFYNLYAKSETYISEITNQVARVVEDDFIESVIVKRAGAVYKY